MSIFQSIKRAIFGYDIFISYSRFDSLDYAYAIAKHFMKKNYECYIDQLSSTAPGKNLTPIIEQAVKRSSSFVLIGSEGAQKSISIQDEIYLFLNNRKNNPLIPITIEDSISDKAIWHEMIVGLALTDDLEGNLIAGTPSTSVLDRIENALKFTKKSTRLRNISLVVLLGVIAISGFAALFTYNKATEANQAIIEKNQADSIKSIAVVEKDTAIKQMSLAIKFKTIADSLKEVAISDRVEADKQKRIADTLKFVAEKKANELNLQSNMLQTRIAGMNQLQKDPLIAYRLAADIYKEFPDKENRKLILSSLSKIDLYYKSLKEEYSIEDFKEPYILLSKKDKNYTKSFLVYNMNTLEMTNVSMKANKVWIIPLSNSYKILAKNWNGSGMDAIPEYQLFDKGGDSISEKIQGGGLGDINFITSSKVSVSLHKQPKILIWDLISGIKSYIQQNQNDGLYFYDIYGALDTKKNGTSAAHYNNGIILIDSSGNLMQDSYTEASFDMLWTNGKWSRDENFLALNYTETHRLGIWNPNMQSFIWLDPQGWIAESYAWSLDGHTLAFSGRTENNIDVILQIVDANKPEKRDTIYSSNIPIKEIVFLPGDKTVAVSDREGNILIIEIDTKKVLASAHQEGISQLYSTKNAFYSSSDKDFRVWSTTPAPSKYWLFQSDSSVTYSANGAAEPSGKWLAVPFTKKNDPIGGLELRDIRTGAREFLSVPDPESMNLKFSENGKWLVLQTFKNLRVWNIQNWKLFYDFPLINNDRQYISLNVSKAEIDAFVIVDLDAKDDTAYVIDISGAKPIFLKRKFMKKDKDSQVKNTNNLANLMDGWETGNLYKYISAGVLSANSPWIAYAKCRDQALGARDCDVQFVPIDIEKLEAVYDDLLWKPTRRDLKKYVHNK